MNTLREAAQQAEAVLRGCLEHPDAADAIAALRAALAEPAIKPDLTTEPVAWAMRRPDGLILDVICPEEHEAYEGEYTIPLYAHPYDQTALELCDTCGWKTLIPGEGCLNCERQPKAEPQEPFGYFNNPALDGWTDCAETDEGAIALYAAPQPRRRLDDKQLEVVIYEHTKLNPNQADDRELIGYIINAIRAIEAAVWGDGK
jgi:hypothetical protein